MTDAVNAREPTKRKEAESDVSRYTEELEEFEVPSPVRLTANDVTPEKLAGLMEENGERIGLMDSEGGIFETFAGRYNDKTPNLDLVLKAHSGDPVRVDRKSALPLSLRSPALTIGLTVQPALMRGLAQKDGFRDRGLLARFLYSLPQTNLGYRTFCSDGVKASTGEAYQERVRALLYAPLPEKPTTLTFSPEAFMRYWKFWEEIEEQFRPEHPLYGVPDWGNKYREAVARLAGLLHIADRLSFECRTIPVETLERAILLGEYFKAHALAVFSEMGLSGKSEACRSILQWIVKSKAESFKRSDVHRALEYRFPTAELLTDPLELLEERGYLREKETLRLVNRGRKPSPTYEVNPSLFNTLPKKTIKTIKSPSTSQNGVISEHDRMAIKCPEKRLNAASASETAKTWEGEV